MEYSAQPDFHAVAEAYPELKAVTLYDNLMKELALTENDVFNARENYNTQVRNYRKHVRKPPASWFLSWFGYEVLETAEYTSFEASHDAPQNLFACFSQQKIIG